MIRTLAVAGLVLAQLTGCGGCVKEDAPQSDPAATGGRKPIDPRAIDIRLTQFSEAADASTD